MARSDERGVALVMALLMVLLVSILTASMIAVARSEAMSSVSYRAMSQVRYGAESGVHAAVNHLLNTYVPPGINPADALANYDMNVSPVTFGGNPVVLSSDSEVAIEIASDREAIANFDMQSLAALQQGDRIIVSRSEHSVRFLHPRGWSYFDTLRQKLHWNEGITGP